MGGRGFIVFPTMRTRDIGMNPQVLTSQSLDRQSGHA